MNLEGSRRLLLGYNPTYGPDVTLWHVAAPFSLVFKGGGLGMRVSSQPMPNTDDFHTAHNHARKNASY